MDFGSGVRGPWGCEVQPEDSKGQTSKSQILSPSWPALEDTVLPAGGHTGVPWPNLENKGAPVHPLDGTKHNSFSTVGLITIGFEIINSPPPLANNWGRVYSDSPPSTILLAEVQVAVGSRRCVSVIVIDLVAVEVVRWYIYRCWKKHRSNPHNNSMVYMNGLSFPCLFEACQSNPFCCCHHLLTRLLGCRLFLGADPSKDDPIQELGKCQSQTNGRLCPTNEKVLQSNVNMP